jgi:hypothetical protein
MAQPVSSEPASAPPAAQPSAPDVLRRHLRWGLWTLAIFALAGLGLEVMHALKLPALVSPGAETRRLLWRLAHAHGALLGLLNLGYGLATPHLRPAGGPTWVSGCLRAATVLLPAGFLLGGVTIYGGDPGPGVVLAPLGGVLLALALIGAARAVRSERS